MGEIFFRFLQKHLLICMIGLLISDVIIFMRRPRLIAAIISLLAGFVGVFIGSILGIMFAFLIEALTGNYLSRLADIGSFVGPVIFMVFSYNLVAKLVKW